MCTGGRKESQLPPAVISMSQNWATQTGAHPPGPGALRSPSMNNIHQTEKDKCPRLAREPWRKSVKLSHGNHLACRVHGHKQTFPSEAELVGKERKSFQANNETGVKTRGGDEVAAPPPGHCQRQGRTPMAFTTACGQRTRRRSLTDESVKMRPLQKAGPSKDCSLGEGNRQEELLCRLVSPPNSQVET